MDVEATTLIELLTSAGALGILAVIVAGAIWEWWIPGKTHRRMLEDRDAQIEALVRDRDEWKNFALRGVTGMDRAVRLVSRTEDHGSTP